MKVLFLNHEGKLGGAEIMLLEFFKNCDRRQVEAELLLFSDGPFAERARHAGIVVIVEPAPESLLDTRRGDRRMAQFLKVGEVLRYNRRIRDHIVRSKPDVVVSNSVKAHVVGSLVMKQLPITYGWRLHDIIDRRDFSFFQRKLLRRFAQEVPRKIAGVSRAVIEPLATKGIGDKLSVLYNGVDLKRFGAGERMFLRSLLNIDTKDCIITLPGRLTPAKGHEVLLRASRSMIQQYPFTRIVIVGEEFFGSMRYRERLEMLARDLGLREHVHFTGFLDDMPSVYAGSDIVAFPSLTPESLPSTILEAMASGIPVVASNIGGVPEIIDNGVQGILIPPGDETVLAKEAASLVGFPDRRSAIAAAGQRRVREQFSLERYVHDMHSWLESLHR